MVLLLRVVMLLERQEEVAHRAVLQEPMIGVEMGYSAIQAIATSIMAILLR